MANLWNWIIPSIIGIVVLVIGGVLWKFWVNKSAKGIAPVFQERYEQICLNHKTAQSVVPELFSQAQPDDNNGPPDVVVHPSRSCRESQETIPEDESEELSQNIQEQQPGRLRRSASTGNLPGAGTGGGGTTQESPVIYRGRLANITEWPFVLALGLDFWPRYMLHGGLGDDMTRTTYTVCTASLIAPDWALTASHCAQHFLAQYYVTGGTDCRPELGGTLMPTARRVRVRRVERPFIRGMILSRAMWLPKWSTIRGNTWRSRLHMKNDITLLKLEHPLTDGADPNYLRHIQIESFDLPPNDENEQGQEIDHVEEIKTAGWGRAGYTDFVEHLRQYSPGPRSLLTEEKSDSFFWRRMIPYLASQCEGGRKLLCFKAGIDKPQTATGDSGGPWIAKRVKKVSGTAESSVAFGSSQPGGSGSGTTATTPAGGSGGITAGSVADWIQIGVSCLGTEFVGFAGDINRPNLGYFLNNVEVEEDEPEFPIARVAALGPRPGAGDADIIVAVRVGYNDRWIRQVMGDGIPWWKRMLGGLWLAVKCVWYFFFWWLDPIIDLFTRCYLFRQGVRRF